MWGGVLDALQRLVDLEHVGDLLCTVCPIAGDAANKERNRLSAAADSRRCGVAYLSEFVTVFEPMRLAMMVAESTVSPL